MHPLEHLFSPVKLGEMTLNNRLVLPPMSINFGVDEEGFVTEQHWEYLKARAKHGPGMIVVGGGAVHKSGLDLPRMPRVWHDKFIGKLSRLVEELAPYESRLGMQLLHGGRQAYLAEKVAPSPLPSLGVVREIPRELTRNEIQDMVLAHARAAGRCKQAGFDFVEIHAAHGYLISEFLAPLSNLRDDDYGGDFTGRTRFLLEILEAIKQETGPEYPVGVRINGEDYIENGWDLYQCLMLAPILEQAGADWLHISAGIYGSFPITIPSMYAKHGCFVHLAKAVKQTVQIPVICVGRIKDPRQADAIIANGEADLVAMGRAQLADPALTEKARKQEFSRIRPCIGCCKGCIDRALALEESTCVMNPEVSREYMLGELKPASQSRRIVIIGAGPAGLACARLAALRGHHVTILEEQAQAGGLARVAALAPGRGEINDMIQYYLAENKRLGVDLCLGARVDQATVQGLAPDKIVLTTGSLPAMPQIQGLFDTEMEMHTVLDAFEPSAPLGNNVLILGGGVAALTLADHLAQNGRRVVVLNRFDHYAPEISANDRTYLRENLKRPEICLYKRVVIKKFFDNGLMFEAQGQRHLLEDFTDLVLAEGMKPMLEAARVVENLGAEVFTIGDAKSPRTLLDSQTEADELGRSL
ncbi:FAD-dependent oxidoreductase [Dethiosulfatarculus sandiegensis]|uniref:oxidoreductase n=1 Tax=Dethiosulfatarculus sandiegensis TaxID=1429043 RepID=UPI0005CAFE90|nr:FAD-dependent oxidoreductase [Dethiosulfatarculus sandiegensis]